MVGSNYSKSQGNKAVIPCYYFMHGGCMKGTDCPFSHQVSDTLPTKSTPDIEAIRKKQEEELKLLQQERIREVMNNNYNIN